jgi:threonine/homoserine/homoserine lactone efflux protein
MPIFLPFIFGLIAAVVGIIPPGLINLTAAKISHIDGKNSALKFVFGALAVIYIQTYISVFFAQYINSHQGIVVLLREIGLVIFIALSVYFLKFAKNHSDNSQTPNVIKSKRNRFLVGMIVSAINFFPIPYYVLISITLASYKLFSFELIQEFGFVFGVLLGSSMVFYLYVEFFNKMKNKADYFIANMNKIIGTITGIVALITLINLLKLYFNGR